jgi:hypothetical protein
MIEGSGSGSIPLTNAGSGSGSRRPKNIRIRIRMDPQHCRKQFLFSNGSQMTNWRRRVLCPGRGASTWRPGAAPTTVQTASTWPVSSPLRLTENLVSVFRISMPYCACGFEQQFWSSKYDKWNSIHKKWSGRPCPKIFHLWSWTEFKQHIPSHYIKVFNEISGFVTNTVFVIAAWSKACKLEFKLALNPVFSRQCCAFVLSTRQFMIEQRRDSFKKQDWGSG